MKRIGFILLGIISSLSTFAQTTTDVINRLNEIQQEKGDSIARNYLISNESVFIQANEHASYLTFWGLLTSNMWNENPNEPLKVEYKKYLESIFDDEVKSDAFQPEEDALSFFREIAFDYYCMLYEEGDKENALVIMKCLHKWFKPYPDKRNTIGYARNLYDLCGFLTEAQRYDELEPYLLEYIDVSKKVFGENSKEYAIALYNSCIIPTMPIPDKAERIKKAMVIYEAAEDYNPTVLEGMRQTYDIQQASMTGIANTSNVKPSSNGIYEIGDCLALIIAGRSVDAIESLLYHKEVLSKQQPLNVIGYSTVITYLISAYIDLNELTATQKEIEDFNSKVGIDNIPPSLSQVFYSSAGVVSMRLRDYPTAIKYLHAARKLSEQLKGEYLEYCKILGNLALTYGELGSKREYKEFLLDAKWYIDEAISVFEEKIGPMDKQGNVGLTLLNNKAYIYAAIGDRKGAIETYEKILSVFAENKDFNEPLAFASNNLAGLYLYTGKYDQSIDLLQKIETNNKEMQDAKAQNLVLAYYLSGKPGIRTPLLNYNEVCRNNCLSAFEYFSEAELENYWTYNARTLMVNNTVAEKYPEVADIAYDNSLFTKRLTLMSSEIIRDYIQAENSPTLTSLYNRIKELRHNIKYNSIVDSTSIWRNELQDKERALILSIPDMKEKFLGSFRTWKEVKNCMQSDEVAIEFVYSIDFGNSKIEDIKIFYGALVLTNHDEQPHFVKIGERDDIEDLCSLYEPEAMTISEFYNKTGNSGLYELIWRKLEPYIKDKKTIYFTPTGILNSLNHDAIIIYDNIRMADVYHLVRVSTTSNIITLKQNHKEPLGSAAIYGGINYDESVDDMREMAKNYSIQSVPTDLLALRAEDERGRWNLLPGTKAEIESISGLFTSNNLHPTIYSWNDANEESFKAMDGKSPSIIHLSTHGYYIDTREKIKSNPFISSLGSSSMKDDMLARTGLLLSGANNVWTGKEKVNGIEDGILTAEEISRLSLKNTKLVVLSACETARGQIDEIDGVLGLQRAFKKAGAGTIVMSLWKVPDIATSLLMTSFYEYLLQGKDSRTALKEAQNHLKKQNDAYVDPYYWAAFVVLD